MLQLLKKNSFNFVKFVKKFVKTCGEPIKNILIKACTYISLLLDLGFWPLSCLAYLRRSLFRNPPSNSWNSLNYIVHSEIYLSFKRLHLWELNFCPKSSLNCSKIWNDKNFKKPKNYLIMKGHYDLNGLLIMSAYLSNTGTYTGVAWRRQSLNHNGLNRVELAYRKVTSSRPIYYSILNSFGQRSQYISIKFPLHKQSENPKMCY